MKKISSLFLSVAVVFVSPLSAVAQIVRVAPVAPITGIGAGASVTNLPTFLPLSASVLPTAGLPGSLSASAMTTPLTASVLPASALAIQPLAVKPVSAQAARAFVPTSAAAESKGLVGSLVEIVTGRATAANYFDSSARAAAPIVARMGLREQKPIILPNGASTDDGPVTPTAEQSPSVGVQTFELPGARGVGGIFDTGRKILNADPRDAVAVETALRALIDAESAKFGVRSSELTTVHVRMQKGAAGLADTIYAYFRQNKDGLAVHGSALSFTIKVINDRPVIMAQTGRVFPQVDVNTQQTIADEQIFENISRRTGMPTQQVGEAFQFVEQKIVFARGRWRNVKLFVAEGLPFMIAADMADGSVFAWDNRAGLQESKPEGAAVSGVTTGKTVDRGPILPTSSVTELPLAFLEIKLGGKSYITDKDGKFKADAGLEIGPEGLEAVATLAGPYTRIEDQAGKTLSVRVKVLPGTEAKVVFNADATLEGEAALAQVNTFHKVNLAYAFLKDNNVTNERMDKAPIPARTNIDDECNAYYTPGRPSLNFFRSSKNCVNSGYDTVADHEYGHYWDDMIGGITNGGLSEGWGDIVSMYLLNNPVIGEHFLKKARGGVDYIRHGENTYQYNEYDEVHDQGQAWGGFAWKLRKSLMEKFGAEQGAAIAQALVLPTMFAKASSIPDAMAQVLMNAIKGDGTISYEAEVRASARAHGVELPAAPGANFVARLVNSLTGPMNRVGGAAFSNETASEGVSGANILAAGESSAPTAKGKISFTAGLLMRGKVVRELRRFLDSQENLTYDIKEYRGALSSDFVIVLEGPADEVKAASDSIMRWFEEISR